MCDGVFSATQHMDIFLQKNFFLRTKHVATAIQPHSSRCYLSKFKITHNRKLIAHIQVHQSKHKGLSIASLWLSWHAHVSCVNVLKYISGDRYTVNGYGQRTTDKWPQFHK